MRLLQFSSLHFWRCSYCRVDEKALRRQGSRNKSPSCRLTEAAGRHFRSWHFPSLTTDGSALHRKLSCRRLVDAVALITARATEILAGAAPSAFLRSHAVFVIGHAAGSSSIENILTPNGRPLGWLDADYAVPVRAQCVYALFAITFCAIVFLILRMRILRSLKVCLLHVTIFQRAKFPSVRRPRLQWSPRTSTSTGVPPQISFGASATAVPKAAIPAAAAAKRFMSGSPKA